jgi:hypothetical protein
MSKTQNITNTVDIDSLYQQAEEQYQTRRKEEAAGYQRDPNILKLKVGATYKGRFVINGKDPGNSRISYSQVAFTSVNGRPVYLGRSPSDLKIKDDILSKVGWAEYQKAKANGSDKDPNAPYKKLMPKRKEAINFYLHEVENDDSQKDKIGTVVILEFPAQLTKDKKTDQQVPSSAILKKIEQGLHGDKAKKIGQLAWLKPGVKNGRSFIVKVTEKQKYPNYDESEFDESEDLGLSDDQIKDIIMNKTHDLTKIIPELKSQEEIKELLDTHYFGTTANSEDELDSDEIPDTNDDDEVIPGLGKELNKGSSSDDDLDDVNLDDL